MKLRGQAKLLRIFISEADKITHTALYEVIVKAAREAGLAGATVWRGLASYGHSSRIHTAKILDFSTDLPIIIEIVDNEIKIDDFIPKINQLFDKADCGGLMTIEQVEVIRYTHSANRN
jgi:PII-like signaling protein